MSVYDETIIQLQSMQLISVRHELEESKQREAELQASKNVLSTWIIELETRVKTLEDAINGALDRDGCRCDTSVCNWCKNDGWVYVSPDNVSRLKQALAAKEPK